MMRQNLKSVVSRIEQARLAYSAHQVIRFIAVSKYHTKDEIQALYQLGQRTFGENKVQDLSFKVSALSHLPLEWHFIGRLQKNKINALLALRPALIHSIDSMELAKALNDRCMREQIRQDILLQVNSANEESKQGVRLESAREVYFQIKEQCKNLNLRGLMSIGAHTDDRCEIDKSFASTKEIFDSIKGADILSMGMSGDFEIAIKNGANLLRIGSALFQ